MKNRRGSNYGSTRTSPLVTSRLEHAALILSAAKKDRRNAGENWALTGKSLMIPSLVPPKMLDESAARA
jgi:hypothetical protein